MVLIRWGQFRLELVGRTQIVIALALIGTVFGLRLLKDIFDPVASKAQRLHAIVGSCGFSAPLKLLLLG